MKHQLVLIAVGHQPQRKEHIVMLTGGLSPCEHQIIISKNDQKNRPRDLSQRVISATRYLATI